MTCSFSGFWKSLSLSLSLLELREYRKRDYKNVVNIFNVFKQEKIHNY